MPASTASPSDSALVIIDAQNEYSSGALKVTNAAASGKVIANLLEKYRSANGKIIHVLHKTPDGAPIFTPGTELADEFKDLKAKVRFLWYYRFDVELISMQDGESTIWKQYPGSFEQTPLHETLESWGIKKVVLTGYMAHVCVSTTAREAFQKGYEVILVEDGIGDRDIPGVKGDEITRVALAELADVFGTVVQSSEIK
jgi:nicotinamidase-related amidase